MVNGYPVSNLVRILACFCCFFSLRGAGFLGSIYIYIYVIHGESTDKNGGNHTFAEYYGILWGSDVLISLVEKSSMVVCSWSDNVIGFWQPAWLWRKWALQDATSCAMCAKCTNIYHRFRNQSTPCLAAVNDPTKAMNFWANLLHSCTVLVCQWICPVLRAVLGWTDDCTNVRRMLFFALTHTKSIDPLISCKFCPRNFLRFWLFNCMQVNDVECI